MYLIPVKTIHTAYDYSCFVNINLVCTVLGQVFGLQYEFNSWVQVFIYKPVPVLYFLYKSPDDPNDHVWIAL